MKLFHAEYSTFGGILIRIIFVASFYGFKTLQISKLNCIQNAICIHIAHQTSQKHGENFVVSFE